MQKVLCRNFFLLFLSLTLPAVRWEGGRSSAASLRRVADEFGITLMKARKLLITAGAYHTEISDEVNKLRAEGKSIEQIMEFTGLKRSSVHSYLPYSKSVYNLNEISLCAERCRLYRQRKKAEEISHCRKLFSVRVKSAVPKDLAYMGQAICIRCLYVSG